MAWSGSPNEIHKEADLDSDSGGESERHFTSGFYQKFPTQHNSPCHQMNCANAEAVSLSTNQHSGCAIAPNESTSNALDSCSNKACNPLSTCGNIAPHGPSTSGSIKNSSMPLLNAFNPHTNSNASNAKFCKTFSGSSNNAPSNLVPFNFNSPTGGATSTNPANLEIAPPPHSRNVEVSCLFSVTSECNLFSNNSLNNAKLASAQVSIPPAATASVAIEEKHDTSSELQDETESIEVCNNGKMISVSPQNVGPLYNWQSTMTTVKERFAFLFNNEILSDVHFLVGKGEMNQRIPAHKFVLSVGSAVFDAMFNGKLGSQQEEIMLPDVEPQAFLALLRFLYSDEVQIGPETVMTVLYTAKKYAVPALERHCVEFLKCNLSPDNAFMLLTQARLFDEPQLASLCLDTIDKNTSEALLADGFPEIDHMTLCLVLERDTLRIREAKLFQAVVRWSEHECKRQSLQVTAENQRNLLGRALRLVRFPLMTIEEFAQGPAQSNILTDKEIVQLFLYFTVNPKPKVDFLDVPRCCMTGKEQTVCRFQQIESRWGYSGTSDRIRFIVDRRIFIAGFGMYGSIHGPSEYEVTIQIIHTATGKVCASNDTTFTSDGTFNTFRVMFKEPVEVLPNTNYTAYATLKGPDSHYGTKGVRKLSVECPSGDRVTFQFTYAAGNNNGTSVEDGQIPEIIFYT